MKLLLADLQGFLRIANNIRRFGLAGLVWGIVGLADWASWVAPPPISLALPPLRACSCTSAIGKMSMRSGKGQLLLNSEMQLFISFGGAGVG